MPEVQNVGAVDYAQYQPSQYQESYVEDYNAQPEIYDDNVAQMQAASKSRLGATLVSGLVVAGLAGTCGYVFGKRGSKKELEQLQNAADKYKEVAQELQKEADKVLDNNFGGYRFGKDFDKTVKEKLENLKNIFDGKAEDVKEGAEKTAEEAKDKAKEAADEAKY